ncbi:hypothetical protein LCGC14_1084290 [marine sediment metagenome]|uniref:Uncharacterized protein n=1 Tax=marine sediment metagenome TaxID=412755 RepID=A0A0F9MEF5_9ZZZZ
MKLLKIYFEDVDFERLKETKLNTGLEWREFILTLTKDEKPKGSKGAKK